MPLFIATTVLTGWADVVSVVSVVEILIFNVLFAAVGFGAVILAVADFCAVL